MPLKTNKKHYDLLYAIHDELVDFITFADQTLPFKNQHILNASVCIKLYYKLIVLNPGLIKPKTTRIVSICLDFIMSYLAVDGIQKIIDKSGIYICSLVALRAFLFNPKWFHENFEFQIQSIKSSLNEKQEVSKLIEFEICRNLRYISS
jgi:hypothetical protein